MENNSSIKENFCILASSYMADDRAKVLKHEETFAVFDRYGDIHRLFHGQPGLYHEGTRYLSKMELFIGEDRPFLLSSNIKDNNILLDVDLTNRDIFNDSKLILPKDTFHIFRSQLIYNACCYTKFKIRNYALDNLDITLALHFDADYEDLFEVRGMKREGRGVFYKPVVEQKKVILGYEGLDKVVRQTILDFSITPDKLSESNAVFTFNLKPKEEVTFCLKISCICNSSKTNNLNFDAAHDKAHDAIIAADLKKCTVITSNEQFNNWLNRSSADLLMMLTNTEHGLYPYAGIPWFNTVFGRDGIISALECLWINPEIAKGVLAYLAYTQAKELIPGQDAEPGKILHETRKGEMANLKEVPFGKYYGTIDATPLFVILANEYLKVTGDLSFIESIWENIINAINWINKYGDIDGDGFVEYEKKSKNGLDNQGWKDSSDSIFYRDGTLAKSPIALCEVQGYTYGAKIAASNIAATLGKAEFAQKLCDEAVSLKKKFNEAFWCEEIGTYAIALDGEKKQCKIKSSNAGQCLFTEIANQDYAEIITSNLFKDDFFNGWGIRTIANTESRYNPISYHNGSVWPHDNALIAYGLMKYGHQVQANILLSGFFDASIFLDLQRLPELFCGFARRPGEGPTRYPVACLPQTWSAVSVFMFLQSCLGLSIDGKNKKVFFHRPLLPQSINEIRISNLKVGSSDIDIMLTRHEKDVGINVIQKEKDIEVIVIK